MPLTLTHDTYLTKLHQAWLGKSVGVTLGQPLKGRVILSSLNFYLATPGQACASLAMDYPLVWLAVLEQCGP